MNGMPWKEICQESIFLSNKNKSGLGYGAILFKNGCHSMGNSLISEICKRLVIQQKMRGVSRTSRNFWGDFGQVRESEQTAWWVWSDSKYVSLWSADLQMHCFGEEGQTLHFSSCSGIGQAKVQRPVERREAWLNLCQDKAEDKGWSNCEHTVINWNGREQKKCPEFFQMQSIISNEYVEFLWNRWKWAGKLKLNGNL